MAEFCCSKLAQNDQEYITEKYALLPLVLGVYILKNTKVVKGDGGELGGCLERRLVGKITLKTQIQKKGPFQRWKVGWVDRNLHNIYP